jgi:hypothetical protein
MWDEEDESRKTTNMRVMRHSNKLVYSIRQDGQHVMEVHRVPVPNPILLIFERVVLPLNPYL